MKYNFHWLKPFGVVEEGCLSNSIIAWNKSAYKIGEREADNDGKIETFISQYRYSVLIDAWFVKIGLTFLGREQS